MFLLCSGLVTCKCSLIIILFVVVVGRESFYSEQLAAKIWVGLGWGRGGEIGMLKKRTCAML